MTRTSATEPRQESGLVYWISLGEAERRFEVAREQLIAAVRAGALQTRRILCEQDLVVAVSSEELDRAYVRRATPAAAPALAGASRTELEELRVRNARLSGELETSGRVERSLQSYADRLERELAEARKQTLTLARALGRAEQLAAASAPRLAESPQRRRRWWNPFG